MNVRRYLKDAFFAEQAMALLRRIVEARQAAIGRRHDEALHDWRVLVRRLIEFTRLWASKSLRREILPLAEPWIDATNAARDGEVEGIMIAALRQEKRNGWAGDLARLKNVNQVALTRELAKLAAFLADPERSGEEQRLTALLAPLPRFPLVPYRLPRRLNKSIERFQTLRNHPTTDLDALHALRLATKSLRYGFEPLAPLDPGIKPVLAELTALQRALGEHRDWERLAETSRQAGLAVDLVQAMELRAEQCMAARPHQFKETDKWLNDGWVPPPLSSRGLRRQLQGRIPKAAQTPVKEAFKLASTSPKRRERTGAACVQVHPLRTALSLLEEAGITETRSIIAALLSAALTDCPAVTEDTLAGQFGSQIVGAVLALAPEPESLGERKGRLEAAPAWIRLVALARELEALRTLAGTDIPRKTASLALERVQALLPVFQNLRSPGALHLLKQLDLLLKIF